MLPNPNPEPFWKNDTFILIVLTLAAFLLRMYYINNTEIISPIRADAAQYVSYGYNLAHFGTFSAESSPTPTPDSFRSPGFPLLLAAAFTVGGEARWYPWALFLQSLLSCLLVPLAYLLSRLFLPRWGVFMTVVMVALSPHLIAMNSYLLTETQFSLTILAALTSYLYAYRQESRMLFILAGLLFGFSYLTNEIGLFIPLILGLVTYFMHRKSPLAPAPSRVMRYLLTGALVFLLFPAGWMLRNTLNVPPGSPDGSSRALATLSHGTYPNFIYKDPAFKYYPYRDDPEQPEFSSSLQNFGKIFWRRFQERPLRYISWYLLEKPYYLWSWEMTQGQGDVYVYPVSESLYTKSKIADYSRLLMKILHYCWMLLCLLGFFALGQRLRQGSKELPIILVFSVLIYITVVYTIFAPWTRYAVPFRPLFYGTGTWTLWLFLSRYSIGTVALVDEPERFGPNQNI